MPSILTRTVICAISSSTLLRKSHASGTLLRLNHGRLIHFAPRRGRFVWRFEPHSTEPCSQRHGAQLLTVTWIKRSSSPLCRAQTVLRAIRGLQHRSCWHPPLRCRCLGSLQISTAGGGSICIAAILSSPCCYAGRQEFADPAVRHESTHRHPRISWPG
jgi:hypothetical protein